MNMQLYPLLYVSTIIIQGQRSDIAIKTKEQKGRVYKMGTKGSIHCFVALQELTCRVLDLSTTHINGTRDFKVIKHCTCTAFF